MVTQVIPGAAATLAQEFSFGTEVFFKGDSIPIVEYLKSSVIECTKFSFEYLVLIQSINAFYQPNFGKKIQGIIWHLDAKM